MYSNWRALRPRQPVWPAEHTQDLVLLVGVELQRSLEQQPHFWHTFKPCVFPLYRICACSVPWGVCTAWVCTACSVVLPPCHLLFILCRRAECKLKGAASTCLPLHISCCAHAWHMAAAVAYLHLCAVHIRTHHHTCAFIWRRVWQICIAHAA